MACRPSPPQGDRMSRRLSPIANVEERAAAPKQPISPLAGEMSGRTEGGASRRPYADLTGSSVTL
ncbi:hypothetical protein CK230_07400 [Mesorhizobium sp. WSM3859]|nr:hypothetical protein CK230_07400 [Mesorhizobium sp. WSM3859]